MRHKVGDIVKISKKSKYYGFTENCNPKNMEGRIMSIDLEKEWEISVKWDNNYSGNFNENDLRLVRRPN